MKPDNYDYPELIIKFLDGSASSGEKYALLSWINESPEHEAEFLEIKKIHDGLKDGKPSFDAQSGWSAILTQDKKKSLRRNARRFVSYAAVFLIAAASATLLSRYSSDKQGNTVTKHIGGDGITADMIELKDGTKVYIGSLTTFYCDASYGHKNRTVYLDGEAYFEVTKKTSRPFVVRTKGMDIEVLGTKFNVSAYAGDSVAVTTLLEGAVQVAMNESGKKIVLKPDQQYIYNYNTSSGRVNPVNASSLISWIDGYYVFREQPLAAIAHHLENMYGVDFELRVEKYRGIKFSGTFYRGQSLIEILELLSVAIPIEYNIKGDRITVCDAD